MMDISKLVQPHVGRWRDPWVYPSPGEPPPPRPTETMELRPPPVGIEPPRYVLWLNDIMAAASKQQNTRDLIRMTLLGLGIGGGLGALLGMRDWIWRPGPKRPEVKYSPMRVDLRLPRRDQAKKQREELEKSSMYVWPFSPREKGAPRQFLKGDWAIGRWTNPLALPTITIATLGSLLGSYSLMRWLTNKVREQQSDAELRGAQKEYQKAVEEMYDKEALARLDPLCDAIEKSAISGVLPRLDTVAGIGSGAYLALASLLTAMAGLGAYYATKARSRRKKTTEVLTQRAGALAMAGPPTVYVETYDPS